MYNVWFAQPYHDRNQQDEIERTTKLCIHIMHIWTHSTCRQKWAHREEQNENRPVFLVKTPSKMFQHFRYISAEEAECWKSWKKSLNIIHLSPILTLQFYLSRFYIILTKWSFSGLIIWNKKRARTLYFYLYSSSDSSVAVVDSGSARGS